MARGEGAVSRLRVVPDYPSARLEKRQGKGPARKGENMTTKRGRVTLGRGAGILRARADTDRRPTLRRLPVRFDDDTMGRWVADVEG